MCHQHLFCLHFVSGFQELDHFLSGNWSLEVTGAVHGKRATTEDGFHPNRLGMANSQSDLNYTVPVNIINIGGGGIVKVSIKSDTGDWCIRVKDARSVTIDKCYWKQSGNVTGILKTEQTFDVHPAVDEEEEEENDNDTSKQPIPFLIRLTRKQTNPAKGSPPPNVATSCLSSISSTLTVEKCHLRKSRFRLSPTFPQKLQQANFCSFLEMRQAYESSQDVRYSLHSSSHSCLELIVKNSGGGQNDGNGSQKSFTPSLSFSKCTSDKKLWQFCTQNGNCSLSLADMKWGSLIRMGMDLPSREEFVGGCIEEDTSVSSLSSSTTTIRTNEKPPQNVEVINGSVTPASGQEINLASTNETTPLPLLPADSAGSMLILTPAVVLIMSSISYCATLSTIIFSTCSSR